MLVHEGDHTDTVEHTASGAATFFPSSLAAVAQAEKVMEMTHQEVLEQEIDPEHLVQMHLVHVAAKAGVLPSACQSDPHMALP